MANGSTRCPTTPGRTSPRPSTARRCGCSSTALQAASAAYSGALTVSSGDLFVGGNSIWGEWFDGLIDEVRVYDHALTAAEIQADMARPGRPGRRRRRTDADPERREPPDAGAGGSWTAPVDWPLVAVHASMLSNGKVAMWDAFGAAMGSERIWDPETGRSSRRLRA